MNILDQFRNDKAAVQHTGTVRQLNEVLSYLLCRPIKATGQCFYYLNNRNLNQTFCTNYTRKESYPVEQYLEAIEVEKEHIMKAKEKEFERIKKDKEDEEIINLAFKTSEEKREKELKAFDAIIKDMKEAKDEPIKDKPLTISIKQHGIKHIVKAKGSNISIFEVKDMFVCALKSAGWGDKTIKEIINDFE